jgi:hypothetical protein
MSETISLFQQAGRGGSSIPDKSRAADSLRKYHTGTHARRWRPLPDAVHGGGRLLVSLRRTTECCRTHDRMFIMCVLPVSDRRAQGGFSPRDPRSEPESSLSRWQSARFRSIEPAVYLPIFVDIEPRRSEWSAAVQRSHSTEFGLIVRRRPLLPQRLVGQHLHVESPDHRARLKTTLLRVLRPVPVGQRKP